MFWFKLCIFLPLNTKFNQCPLQTDKFLAIRVTMEYIPLFIIIHDTSLMTLPFTFTMASLELGGLHFCHYILHIDFLPNVMICNINQHVKA